MKTLTSFDGNPHLATDLVIPSVLPLSDPILGAIGGPRHGSPEICQGLLQSMQFGIEHERFLLREDGLPPNYSESDAFFRALEKQGYSIEQFGPRGQIYCAALDSEWGRIAVKHDFATHLIETEFPPLVEPKLFPLMATAAWEAQRAAAQDAGLIFIGGGSLPELPRQIFVSSGKNDLGGRRVGFMENLPDTGLPLFQNGFMGTCCSTHVNLSIPNEILISRLPRYYAFEYLTPLLFSTSQTTFPIATHCVRPLRYRDSLPSEYLLVNVPTQLPTTSEEHQAMCARQIRDYSSIVPRGNRAEFRSACSQPDANRILMLTCLKMLTHLIAQGDAPIQRRCSSAIFDDVCWTGAPPSVISADFKLLCAAAARIPDKWSKYCAAVLSEVRRCVDLAPPMAVKARRLEPLPG